MHTNKQAITAHYDIDPDFFLSFLDPKTPCYTQGVYESADETLDAKTETPAWSLTMDLGIRPMAFSTNADGSTTTTIGVDGPSCARC